MSELKAVYPRDQVFEHNGDHFVLGKQDGTNYAAYPVVTRKEAYCKDTGRERRFSAFDIAGKRLANQLGPAYVMLEEYLWRSESACEA